MSFLYIAIVVALTTQAFVSGQVAPSNDVGYMKSLFVHGDHFSVGQQMGYATKTEIHRRFTQDSIQALVKWVATSDYGKSAFDAMLTSANSTFPEYVEELEGMAYGSGVSFQNLFILNVRNELKTFKANMPAATVTTNANANVDFENSKRLRGSDGDGDTTTVEVEHCSDYLLMHPYATPSNPRSEVVLGHNEDGGTEDRQQGCLITAHMHGKGVREEVRYTAFVYAGDLPSDAFFWNEHGIVGSFNGLYPTYSLWGGLGRNFISRHTLGARSMDDAVERATMTNQATGHSYNFVTTVSALDSSTGNSVRMLNVEVAPGVDNADPEDKSPLVAITHVTQQSANPEDNNSLFHANAYKFIEVNETNSQSSAHRMARAAELPPPQDATEVCIVLGDTEDQDWPIYRDGSSSEEDAYTLVTALFTVDLDAVADVESTSVYAPGSVTLFLSNPKTNSAVNVTYNSLYIA